MLLKLFLIFFEIGAVSFGGGYGMVSLRNLLKYTGVQAFLGGVRPCIAALILATALTMGLDTLLGLKAISGGLHPDLRAVAIFALLCAVSFLLQRYARKSPSPILMILLSAGLGIVFYGLL